MSKNYEPRTKNSNKNLKQPYKIIFLNQRSGTFFQELAKDIAKKHYPSALWTQIIGQYEPDGRLIFTPAPGYNRTSFINRIFSWLAYFFYAGFKCLFYPKSLLFIVTMPPFLGLVGYLLKKIRGQKYVILVFDIYPDLLMKVGGLRNSWIIKCWRKMNSIVLSNADAVFTIGEYMAQNLAGQFDVKKTTLGEIAVVPIWADVDWLKPIAKEQNSFIREHCLDGKFVVMYSGNIGATHDIETLLEAIRRMKDRTDIQFVIIGDGAKKRVVLDFQKQFALDNLLVLPYVPQERLPFSLSAADVAVVSMEGGTEGYLVPSRVYSSLAAGNAVIAACGQDCEMTDIVEGNQCGTVVRSKDADAMVSAIDAYYQNRILLDQTKANSRRAAVEKYSRKNSSRYIEVLEKLLD